MPRTPASRPPLSAAAAALLGTWVPGRLDELGALRRSVITEARRRRATSGARRGSESEQRLLLVVTELTTNALRHGDELVAVTLYRDGDDWLVDVVDTRADAAPVLNPPSSRRIGGNGLLIVDRVATRWGWYHDSDVAGVKHVWAAVPDG